MKRCWIFLLMFLLQSCFLFNKFKKSSFTYSENGVARQSFLMVPKKYRRVERNTDSLGNEMQTFHYAGGALLYFVRTRDTIKQYQPIDYEINLPKELYGSVFFKGIDLDNRYWRENRKSSFRSGYRFVYPGKDWQFDSALNYFSLRIQ